MKKHTFVTHALASLALTSSCGTKQDTPKSAADVQVQAAGDGIFKYTITTNIDAGSDDIEILAAMNCSAVNTPSNTTSTAKGTATLNTKR